MVAIAEIFYDCSSPCIIESKSLKLYFNSFNNSKFNSVTEVEEVVVKRFAGRVGGEVFVAIYPLRNSKHNTLLPSFEGECLDDLDITLFGLYG